MRVLPWAIIVLLSFFSAWALSRQPPSLRDELEKVIKISKALSNGDKFRRDLEEHYILGGGITSVNSERHSYLELRLIHIDVVFEPVVKGELNDNDKIISVSNPYLQYPAID